MRDKRFITEHRGGLLKKEQHRQLMRWACACVEHVFPLLPDKPDRRLEEALRAGRGWERGEASVGEARNASVEAIALANESADGISEAIARAAGHAVATAHMADHAVVAALYALKAAKNAGNSIDAERNWQNEQLPAEVRELVFAIMPEKLKGLKL